VQPLALAHADAVGADRPAGLVEQSSGELRVVRVGVRLLAVAERRAAERRRGERVGLGEDRRDDLLAVDAGDERLPHADVLQQRVVEAEAQAVVHAGGLGGVQAEARRRHLLLVLRLHLARDVRLP
jgi:hypothetical protein